jgi:hypothetical protein
VGSFFGCLLVLLDVRRDWTDYLNPFSHALKGFRDRLSRSCPLRDELREESEESPDCRKNFDDDVKESLHYLKESVHYLKGSLHHLKGSLHYLKESFHYLKESFHYLKEASHRRFRPKSASLRLLPCVEDGAACVD